MSSSEPVVKSLKQVRVVLTYGTIACAVFTIWIFLQTMYTSLSIWDSTLGFFRWLEREHVLDLDALAKLDNGKFGRDPLDLGEFIVRDPMHWASNLGSTTSFGMLIVTIGLGLLTWRVARVVKLATEP